MLLNQEIILKFQKKIIISRLLDSDHAMTTFLFESPTSVNLREHPYVLTAESWELKDEERILVGAALDIWCGRGNVFLWELLSELSPQNFSRLILALIHWRNLKIQVNGFAPTQAEPKI